MTLPFSTIMNGKPNQFVEKIIYGFWKYKIISVDLASELLDTPMSLLSTSTIKPKIHTVRLDLLDRWDVGKAIHPVTGNRTPNRKQFAPTTICTGVQDIVMTYAHSELIQISIDSRELFGYGERLEFAHNDGFDTWEDFFNYWYPIIQESKGKCYVGKVIHWTDKKY